MMRLNSGNLHPNMLIAGFMMEGTTRSYDQWYLIIRKNWKLFWINIGIITQNSATLKIKVALAHPAASNGVCSRHRPHYNGNYSKSSIFICLYASFSSLFP